MVLKGLGYCPVDSDYWDYEDFDSYEEKGIEGTGCKAAFYWYGRGSYDGSGQMLALHEKGWYLFNLGHCSCYGPTENICFEGAATGESLESIKERCSEDYYVKEILPLVELALANGYK